MTEPYEDILAISKPTLKEAIFIKTHLPRLISKDSAVFTKGWLQISKNPYNEVDIIDDQGNVVFTVPPLRYAVRTGLGTGISRLANDASQLAKLDTRRSESLLSKVLPSVLTLASDVDKNMIIRWENIVRRFGHGDLLVNDDHGESSSGIDIDTDMDEW